MLYVMLAASYPFGRPEDERMAPSARMHAMLQACPAPTPHAKVLQNHHDLRLNNEHAHLESVRTGLQVSIRPAGLRELQAISRWQFSLTDRTCDWYYIWRLACHV